METVKKKRLPQIRNKNCVEVLCFHSKQRCVTCRAIESLTKEVLDSYYANEQSTGNVVFKVIDISQKENDKIANKYKVTWSSLILDKGGNVENLTKMAFSYAKNRPEIFKSKLKASLDKMMQ